MCVGSPEKMVTSSQVATVVSPGVGGPEKMVTSSLNFASVTRPKDENEGETPLDSKNENVRALERNDPLRIGTNKCTQSLTALSGANQPLIDSPNPDNGHRGIPRQGVTVILIENKNSPGHKGYQCTDSTKVDEHNSYSFNEGGSEA